MRKAEKEEKTENALSPKLRVSRGKVYCKTPYKWERIKIKIMMPFNLTAWTSIPLSLRKLRGKTDKVKIKFN